MKQKNKQFVFPALKYSFFILLMFAIACSKQIKEDAKPPEPVVGQSQTINASRVIVTIQNPGFESDKANWGNVDLFAISTSDVHSGTKSAKLGSSGDKIEQAVTVTANTAYTLKAWIYQKGTLGAKVGSTTLGSISVNSTSAFTQQTVNFNSGSNTSITIYGAYNGGTGRFDDFTLETTDSTASTPPTAPSALAATASGLNINLTWTDNSSDETGFKLERKTGSGGTYAEIAGSIAANATTYADNALTAGTTYFYRLRSYNAAGNSSYTAEVSATTATAPVAPSSLAAAATGTTINLTWTDNSSNETGFKIERKTGSGGTYAEIVSNQAANTTSYSNTGLTAGTTYYYRIRSYNAAGNSAYSAEASATTGTAGNLPANVLNLTNWKLTLPINSSGTQTGSTPLEVSQPALATYSVSPYFQNNASNTGVIFQANTGGVTTSGSNYPRSELREMTNNGASNASWSSTSGTHTMEIDEAITHLPVVKPHIVAGQIHDADDDVIVFRLEGTKLFMDHNGADGATLDANYVLGTRFTVKFVVTGGQVMSYYNGVLKETYTKSFSGAYFKAGAYTQSSCKSGKTPGPTESCSAYGEVVIYNVTVTHN